MKVNTVDTPGYSDFAGEVYEALAVTDSAVLVVCGASGVEVGTEQNWKRARERNMPVAVFVNKLDRENADFLRIVEQLHKRVSSRTIALQLPIGKEAQLQGVVDLISGKAYRVKGNSIEEGESARRNGRGYRGAPGAAGRSARRVR